MRVGDGASAALLDPDIGDRGRGDRVALADRLRVDLAVEAQHVHVAVDPDLLFARDQQVPIGQHPGDDGGDGAGASEE